MAGNSSEIFADYAAATRFGDLPQDVRALAKLILLDFLGTAMAASTIDVGCRSALAFARTAFGGGDSVIWGTAETASPMATAFANGALVHALNYDTLGAGYAGIVVPCVMAAADGAAPVSGEELLTALVLGIELLARIQAAATQGKGGHGKTLDGQLQSYFGCALAAAKVMKLSPPQIHDAIGLALMQAAGSFQIVLDGDPPAKAIYGAFPSQGGLQAAFLAKHGLAAPCDAFEGPAGLLQAHYPEHSDVGILTAGLGAEYLMRRVYFKPWPTSSTVHLLIAAVLALKREHRLVPADIEAVAIAANGDMQAWFEPAALRRVPPNAAAAANSAPFVIAKALVHGAVTLGDFTPRGLEDDAALAMAGKLTASFGAASGAPAKLVITMTDGKVHERSAGGAPIVMNDADLKRKFRECLAYAADRRLAERGDAIIEMVGNLEAIDNCASLAALLTFRDSPNSR